MGIPVSSFARDQHELSCCSTFFHFRCLCSPTIWKFWLQKCWFPKSTILWKFWFQKCWFPKSTSIWKFWFQKCSKGYCIFSQFQQSCHCSNSIWYFPCPRNHPGTKSNISSSYESTFESHANKPTFH